jgi:uncharacterized protein DUF6941
MEERDRINLSFNLRMVKFPQPGRYKVHLLIDGKEAFARKLPQRFEGETLPT